MSYNVRELLAECLASVEESGRPLRQEIIVVVVDNASEDGRSQRHYLMKQFGWLRAAAVRFLLAVDSYLSRLLQLLGSISEDLSGPISPGASLDLRDCPVSLSWPAAPGATRYLFEVSVDASFQGTAARFVTGAEVELPLDEFRKPGFPRIYWRAVPFCGDEPMAPWVAT